MTSSGFCDGLGRRVLAFDREDGSMLERLIVRPDLAAFERILRDRVERLAALEDERLARPRSVEREPNGGVAVVSEFVPGSRLADLLDASAESGIVPGIDAALGYLLDVFPALCGLHAGIGFAHGTIAPSRTVITPAGQVVLLDAAVGGALAHLRYSRRRLWSEFGVATPASAGGSRLGVDADIAQIALSGMLLIVGRPLRPHDFPDALGALLREVGDVARIRAGDSFADVYLHFLHRALVLPGSRPYPTADDALIELRELADVVGTIGCRRALVDFIEQMDAGRPPAARFDAVEMEPAWEGAEDAEVQAEASRSSLQLESELDLDGLTAAEADFDSVAPIELQAEPAADDTLLEAWTDTDPSPGAAGPETLPSADQDAANERLAFPAIEAAAPPRAAPFAALDAQPVPPATPEPSSPDEAPADSPSSVRARRAKRTRPTRGRKDKLRSAASHVAAKPASRPADPTPAGAPRAAASNWLVPPDRAVSFESPVTSPPQPQATVPQAQASAPASLPPVPEGSPGTPAAPQPWQPPKPTVHLAPPLTPAAPVLQTPAFSGVPAPGADPGWPQPSTAAAPPTPALQAATQEVGTFKLREPAKPAPRRERTAFHTDPGPPPPSADAPHSRVPRRAAAALAAAIILVVMGVVGARKYLSEPAAGSRAADGAPVAAAGRPASAVSKAAGVLEIETQPAGARVLLDGKPVGESPLTLDTVAPGRHMITVVSSAGTVRKSVRVEAGQTAKLDIPIFSGWVGIYAPFVVQIAEDGRQIGTNEEPRLMLSPGRHVLTLTNRDLNFSSQQTVDIEPGKLQSVTLDPRGSANLNASPWAEVWIDGNRIGDTPIANHPLPLGIREIVFRHPDLGERRATVTIKADAPSVVSVDLTRP